MAKSYHVQHILVEKKYEAEDLLRKLHAAPSASKNTEKTFTELAQKFSKCPSAERGGDLGQILWGRADADFEEAAAALKPGEVSSEPVRTKFGYHLILRRA